MDYRDRGAILQNLFDFGAPQTCADGHDHPTREYDGGHADDGISAVGEHHGHAVALPHASRVQSRGK